MQPTLLGFPQPPPTILTISSAIPEPRLPPQSLYLLVSRPTSISLVGLLAPSLHSNSHLFRATPHHPHKMLCPVRCTPHSPYHIPIWKAPTPTGKEVAGHTGSLGLYLVTRCHMIVRMSFQKRHRPGCLGKDY